MTISIESNQIILLANLIIRTNDWKPGLTLKMVYIIEVRGFLLEYCATLNMSRPHMSISL